MKLQDMHKVRKLSLESEEMRRDLKWFQQSLQASYGPFGVAALFQPSPGGHVTVTARSEKIFQMLKTSNPVLKTLTSALQIYAQRYHECGLFAGLLATRLILNGMELGLPRHKVAMVTSHALSLVSEYLGSDRCGCRRPLELSSAEQMISLIRSCLSSKSALCALGSCELDHISSLLLQGFLHVIPTASDNKPLSVKDRLHLHVVTGQSVTRSRLVQGLLVESSDGNDGWNVCVKRDKEGLIVTALFDVSMAGDPSEEFPREMQLVSADPTVRGSRTMEAAVVQQLRTVAVNLVEEGVGFVGCQKCIHPTVKEYLREQGVVVVDRLSAFHIGSVREATGGKLISSFTLKYPNEWLGRLKDIGYTTVEDRRYRYWILEGFSTHSSLVLCCKSETVADELKPLCSTAISLLEQALHHPFIFYGGGCMETFLCNFLEEKATEVTEKTLLELHCDKRTFSRVMQSVARSFALVSASLEHYGGLPLTDTALHHCWSFPPYQYCEEEGSSDLCGKLETKESSVLKQNLFDEKTCCCGAVRLKDLPPSATWQTLLRDEFAAIPEMITKLLDSRGHIGDNLPSLHDCGMKADTILAPDTQCASGSNYSKDKLLSSAAIHSNTHHSSVEAVGRGIGLRTPSVCDPFLPKLKAVELANDLSCSILRIAYALTENM